MRGQHTSAETSSALRHVVADVCPTMARRCRRREPPRSGGIREYSPHPSITSPRTSHHHPAEIKSSNGGPPPPGPSTAETLRATDQSKWTPPTVTGDDVRSSLLELHGLLRGVSLSLSLSLSLQREPLGAPKRSSRNAVPARAGATLVLGARSSEEERRPSKPMVGGSNPPGRTSGRARSPLASPHLNADVNTKCQLEACSTCATRDT
jgi:hypothetical protein